MLCPHIKNRHDGPYKTWAALHCTASGKENITYICTYVRSLYCGLWLARI